MSLFEMSLSEMRDTCKENKGKCEKCPLWDKKIGNFCDYLKAQIKQWEKAKEIKQCSETQAKKKE